MRLSPLRHPLAILRTTIGLTQDELGALVGRSARTIQAIELQKLPLSEDLALIIAQQTGVDVAWLLEGNPMAPLRTGTLSLWAGLKKGEYDKEYYEFYRSFLECPAASAAQVRERLSQDRIRAQGSPDKAAAMLLREAMEENNPASIGIAKVLLAETQAKRYVRLDGELESLVRQILEQTAGSERATLVRWKMRRFIDELANENSVKLKVRPLAELMARSAPAPSLGKRVNGWFKYTPPPGWFQTATGPDEEFEHPSGAFLIASAVALKPVEGGRDAEMERDRKIENATAEGLKLPFLKITGATAPELRAAGVQGWTATAENIDGKRIAARTLLKYEGGLLMVAYDAPNTPEAVAEYDRFLRSIEAHDPEPAPEPRLGPLRGTGHEVGHG